MQKSKGKDLSDNWKVRNRWEECALAEERDKLVMRLYTLSKAPAPFQ